MRSWLTVCANRCTTPVVHTTLALVAWIAAAEALAAEEPAVIQRVDLVHMTHTDIGFTDHPAVTRELQKRFLDIAIDAVLADDNEIPGSQFCWTAETTLAVDDWWKAADPARREEFLRAVDTGRLEVAALAMNQTPLLSAAQWRTMLHWLPEHLWERAQPQVAIQNDVNGMPRAGAVAMLDRGVPFLWMGINVTNGGSPRPQPSAFWWKMPDGRRLFVWLGEHYARGYYYFHPASWRRGPVPEATDTRYRPARPGDFFRGDEASVRAAHAHLRNKLKALEGRGYDYPSLVLSITNEWRMDNDPPFPPLADFVACWNRLELEPELRLTTAARALQDLREAIGDRIPEFRGEWTDWWANGSASGPREVSASRRAKRLVRAALSPAWGPVGDRAAVAADGIRRSLCLFDEHTWGSADSVALPHAIDTWGQYNAKSRHAYHGLAMAKLLLARRARSAIYAQPPGFYVVNTTGDRWSGWVEFPATCLRENARSLVEQNTGTRTALEVRPGFGQFVRPASPEQLTYENTAETCPDNLPGRAVRFWVSDLEAHQARRYDLSAEQADPSGTAQAADVETDDRGWPVRATWPGMPGPLFNGELGELVGVGLEGFSARWNAAAARRNTAKQAETMPITLAQPAENARVERNAHTTLFAQRLSHPRLLWATRRVELFHHEPRARVEVRFHRKSSELPEWFFIGFSVSPDETLPETSCGGMAFRPFVDQLAGTCRDYFGIDSWVSYPADQGSRIWVSHDAPLVRFGQPRLQWNTASVPERPGRVYAMVFDNTWFTNFVGDSHGVFAFRFDLAWRAGEREQVDRDAWAESLMQDPQVVVHPELSPDAIFMKRLHRP